jgi:CRISPR/Cas system-associated endoribonuclease Cas2
MQKLCCLVEMGNNRNLKHQLKKLKRKKEKNIQKLSMRMRQIKGRKVVGQ